MVLVGLCVQAGRGVAWRGEDSRYRFLSFCFDWLRLNSGDAVEDVYDPEVPNQRLLPCSLWTAYTHQCNLSMHDIITIAPKSYIQFLQFPTQSEEIKNNMGLKQQLQTTAPSRCDALNMTIFLVSNGNVGVRREIMTR